MPQGVGGCGVGVEVGGAGGLRRGGELGEHVAQREDEAVDELRLVC